MMCVLGLLIFWLSAVMIGMTFVGFMSGISPYDHDLAFAVIGFAAGFSCVFAGSLWLIGNSRRLACVILLLMGLTYYHCFWWVSGPRSPMANTGTHRCSSRWHSAALAHWL